MKKPGLAVVVVCLLVGLTALSTRAADFGPIFPFQGKPVVASPSFTWSAGDYDLFGLYLLLPLPGGYQLVGPIWRYRTPSFATPEALWDNISTDGWGLWLVLGLNTSTWAYEVTAWQYFQKVADCEVTFPDPNLESVIRSDIGKPTGEILASDLAPLTGLNAFQLGIADISGLEYCANLQWLDLSRNPIVDIGPLAGLANLMALGLSANAIVDIAPLAGLTNLVALSLTDNQVTHIGPLAGLTGLRLLALWKNQIADIQPLANLANLVVLYLWENQIVDIGPLASLTNLERLGLGDNLVVDVQPLVGLIHLLELGLDGNQIEDTCPLVDNPGLDAGDAVVLAENPLSPTSCTVCIPELESRGVSVGHTCP